MSNTALEPTAENINQKENILSTNQTDSVLGADTGPKLSQRSLLSDPNQHLEKIDEALYEDSRGEHHAPRAIDIFIKSNPSTQNHTTKKQRKESSEINEKANFRQQEEGEEARGGSSTGLETPPTRNIDVDEINSQYKETETDDQGFESAEPGDEPEQEQPKAVMFFRKKAPNEDGLGDELRRADQRDEDGARFKRGNSVKEKHKKYLQKLAEKKEKERKTKEDEKKKKIERRRKLRSIVLDRCRQISKVRTTKEIDDEIEQDETQDADSQPGHQNSNKRNSGEGQPQITTKKTKKHSFIIRTNKTSKAQSRIEEQTPKNELVPDLTVANLKNRDTARYKKKGLNRKRTLSRVKRAQNEPRGAVGGIADKAHSRTTHQLARGRNKPPKIPRRLAPMSGSGKINLRKKSSKNDGSKSGLNSAVQGSKGVKEGSRRTGRASRADPRSFSAAKTMKLPLTTKNSQRQQPGSPDAYKTLKAAKSSSVVPKKKSNSSKLRSFSFITDVKSWLKKNRLPATSKVFIITEGYTCIKQALLDRGWIKNPDYFSSCYHLKFTLRGSHIDFDHLKDYQITNHFEKVSVLTTKVGLCKTMNNLHWYTDVNLDSFFPKCFDCNEEIEFEAFLMYYKVTRAECILKKFLSYAIGGKREEEGYKQMVKTGQVEVALKVTKRRLMSLGELIDTKKNWTEVTEKEWDVLSKGDMTEEDIKKLLYNQNVKRYLKLNKKMSRRKKRKKKKKKTKKSSDSIAMGKKKGAGKVNSKIIAKSSDSEDDEGENKPGAPLTAQEQEIQSVLENLAEKFPQTKINGMNNIWIVKPAGLSRGRGIKLFASYAEIIHHIKTRDFSWIIQKYMENPLLYKNKKIDIRQWVLVTDWNPLTIWFYQECYIRISTGEFTLSNIKNRYIHLTNNSVNKKAANFSKEDGFMSQEQMVDWIDAEYGEGSFKWIQKQMKRQVKWSLKCAQASVENRKNSGEIFGYDFCIDDDLGVWLIEVNASPDFTFSSKVTEALVRKASEDWVRVMVDYGTASKKKRKGVDTGLFKRIYKSKKHDKCKQALGLKFEVTGKKLKMDKVKKFFRKEDRQYKKNQEVYEEDCDQIFNQGPQNGRRLSTGVGEVSQSSLVGNGLDEPSPNAYDRLGEHKAIKEEEESAEEDEEDEDESEDISVDSHDDPDDDEEDLADEIVQSENQGTENDGEQDKKSGEDHPEINPSENVEKELSNPEEPNNSNSNPQEPQNKIDDYDDEF